MFQRRLLAITSAGIFLLFGLFIGLTLNKLWFPSTALTEQVATPAQALDSVSTAGEPQGIIRRDKSNEVTRVVEVASPSVVTVGAMKRTLVPQAYSHDEFFLIPSVRYAEKYQKIPYLGSGFIVDEEGHVVTNFHVIDGAESFFITLTDGRELPAELVDADRYSDMALLRVRASQDLVLPPPIGFADSDVAMIGETVIALGNPFGNLIEDSHPTVTVGHVSALNRTFSPDRQNGRVYQDMIQTDAAINPGNSGGPLLDINGELLGINTFIFSPSGGNTGVGFAIPSNRVKTFVSEIKEYGRLRPLMLDFAFRTVNTRNGPAVQVLGMENGGPAAQAGLQPGDVIVRVDGRRVTSREEFYILFASKHVGDDVEIEVARSTSNELLPISYKVREATRVDSDTDSSI